MSTRTLTFSEIERYIETNSTAVIGTLNDDGSLHGAVVYICTASDKRLFFITKNFTQKYINILERPQVSVTIFNETQSSTLQISGTAYVVHDAQLIEQTLQKISAVHAHRAEWLPPIAKLRAGPYELIGVKIKYARLANFAGVDIGSEDIFAEFSS